MRILLQSLGFSCVLGVSTASFGNQIPSTPEEINREKDFFLVKSEILNRLGEEYRHGKMYFKEDDLDLEVDRAEYLYTDTKRRNPYQYPGLNQLFYKKTDLYKYLTRKINYHSYWVQYTNKFLRKINIDEYKYFLNFTNVPFSTLFQEFLNYEQSELTRWKALSETVHSEPQKYLLEGPFHPHQITGVDQLHAQGLNGEGTEVIVWDVGFVGNKHVNFSKDDGHIKKPELDQEFHRRDEHGTHVSGIIAADKASRKNKGVAYGASILPVDYETVPDLIDRIKNSPSKVISASFHFLLHKNNIRYLDLLSAELEKNDRLLVMAAGNNSQYLTPDGDPDFLSYWMHGMWFGTNSPWVLAKNPNLVDRMILVGSLREDGKTVSRFSTLPGVLNKHFVFSPGENVLSTMANDKFGKMSGTSMATPHVSGILALMSKYNPDLSALELKNCLLTTCDPFWQQTLSQQHPDIYGNGRVNAVKAFEAATELAEQKQAEKDAEGDSVDVDMNFEMDASDDENAMDLDVDDMEMVA